MNLPKKVDKGQVWLAGCFLTSVGLAFYNTAGPEGTEFSGGWLTGRLLSMADLGAILFAVGFVAVFFFPRTAALVGLVSSLLCLPLYLYLVAPVPFNGIFGFGHEFKVQTSAGLHWVAWANVEMTMTVGSGYLSLRCLRTPVRGR